MTLKQFGLHWPGGWAGNGFEFATRSVVALYQRCFSPLRVEKVWKVLIECVDEVSRADVLDLSGVLVLQVEFDTRAFIVADRYRRNVMALEVLHRGATRIAGMQGWPLEPFESAKACVEEMDYKNEKVIGQVRRSPDRRHYAFLYCLHEPDKFRGWLVVQDKDRAEVVRKLVVETLPDEFIFHPQLGKVSWTGNDRVVLHDRSGAEIGQVELGQPASSSG
jgi:hypothetical protein